MNATTEHRFSYATDGVNGRTVGCSCGFQTAHHRLASAAADEWRAHAGLPPVRPDLHPAWCDELYEQTACDIHVGSLGVIALGDAFHVIAVMDDSGPDRSLVVTVSVLTDNSETEHRIPVDLSPKPGKRVRKPHAFTAERTNGDHVVWRCSCGEVFVEDGTDPQIHAALLTHAMGGAR